MDIQEVKKCYQLIMERINGSSIGCFEGMDRPLFYICDRYPGIWLEHVQDAILYAEMEPSANDIAKNTLDLFIDLQSEEGQYPCYILNPARVPEASRKGVYKDLIGFSQTQECVSFAKLCLRYVKRTHDSEMLKKAYESGKKWVGWWKKYRMISGRGLVEMFVGYDTGHDHSGRLRVLSKECNYVKDGVFQNASVLPPDDDVAPVLAVDLNCDFYATLRALAEMARMLGKQEESDMWENDAAQIKKNLFTYCYNEEDAFFYDVDKHGNQLKTRSCAILHLFMEGVLDEIEDAETIRLIKERHLKNPDEFWTPYPFPSMAINDPIAANHAPENSWDYFTMGLTALRGILWMDRYHMSDEMDYICRRWVETWTDHYVLNDRRPFGQEIDPITGIPTNAVSWYSATMIFYIYAVRRLGLLS